MSSVILGTACQHITDWRDQYEHVPMVAVNISTLQLRRPNFVASIARLFEQYPDARGYLSLEVTESFEITDNNERHRPVLAGLKELGVSIAIDAFGTGYSTLSYLRDLSVDVLKIDQSFTVSAALDESHASLLEGILSLGKGLGLRVMLEGVGTPAQLAAVSAMHFDGLQGFLLSKQVARSLAYTNFDRVDADVIQSIG